MELKEIFEFRLKDGKAGVLTTDFTDEHGFAEKLTQRTRRTRRKKRRNDNNKVTKGTKKRRLFEIGNFKFEN